MILCSEASRIWYSCRTNVKNGKIVTTEFFRGEYSQTYSSYAQNGDQILSEISPSDPFMTPQQLVAALPVTSMRFCVGDKFFLKNNMILCQTDYEEGLMKEGYAPQVR
ncbi:hypothetical protein Q9966_009966 [Columba livia]|nr:hypothetical protein Q9966_009966 [Columba livia]